MKRVGKVACGCCKMALALSLAVPISGCGALIGNLLQIDKDELVVTDLQLAPASGRASFLVAPARQNWWKVFPAGLGWASTGILGGFAGLLVNSLFFHSSSSSSDPLFFVLPVSIGVSSFVADRSWTLGPAFNNPRALFFLRDTRETIAELPLTLDFWRGGWTGTLPLSEEILDRPLVARFTDEKGEITISTDFVLPREKWLARIDPAAPPLARLALPAALPPSSRQPVPTTARQPAQPASRPPAQPDAELGAAVQTPAKVNVGVPAQVAPQVPAKLRPVRYPSSRSAR